MRLRDPEAEYRGTDASKGGRSSSAVGGKTCVSDICDVERTKVEAGDAPIGSDPSDQLKDASAPRRRSSYEAMSFQDEKS